MQSYWQERETTTVRFFSNGKLLQAVSEPPGEFELVSDGYDNVNTMKHGAERPCEKVSV